jgi:hypothetical protein
VNIPDPPRYRFKKSSDSELILELGRSSTELLKPDDALFMKLEFD